MDLKEILQKENELKDELAKLQKLKSKVTDSNIDWDMLNEINERLSEYGVTLILNILGEFFEEYSYEVVVAEAGEGEDMTLYDYIIALDEVTDKLYVTVDRGAKC